MSRSTTRKTSHSSKIYDVILRVAYALLLYQVFLSTLGAIRGLFTGPRGFFSFTMLGLAQWMGLASAVVGIMLIPTLALLVLGRPLNKQLRIGANILLAFALVVVLFVRYGLVRDAMGEACSGLSLKNARLASCVGNQTILAALLFFNPLVYLSALATVAWNLGFGWRNYLNDRQVRK